jgi:hypothetical protein
MYNQTRVKVGKGRKRRGHLRCLDVFGFRTLIDQKLHHHAFSHTGIP